MKNFLLAISISILVGCSSIELEAVSSSDDEVQRILSLGLSHEENLKLANELKSSHMRSVVSGQLIKARDKKIQEELELVESIKISEEVEVSDDGLNFVSSMVTESVRTGVLDSDFDNQSYFIEGIKDSNNGKLHHILNVKIAHNSKNKRNYYSANLCDEWMRCDSAELVVQVLSSSASNCSTYSCDFNEEMQLKFPDNLLRSNMISGLKLKINAKRKTNKISLSSSYIRGYLDIAN